MWGWYLTLNHYIMKLVTIKKHEIQNYKLLPFNRYAQVRRDLINKINQYGFTVPILIIETDVIIGKKELYVVDGQHRLLTASYLNVEPQAIILSNTFNSIPEVVDFVAALNATHKSWILEDYVNAYAHLAYPEYITLNKVKSEAPYSLATLACMLYGFRTKGSVASMIRNGTFKCKLLEETLNTLKFAAKLSKYGILTSRMLIALHYVYHSNSNFNEDFFEDKYKQEYYRVRELKLDDYSDEFSSWIQ